MIPLNICSVLLLSQQSLLLLPLHLRHPHRLLSRSQDLPPLATHFRHPSSGPYPVPRRNIRCFPFPAQVRVKNCHLQWLQNLLETTKRAQRPLDLKYWSRFGWSLSSHLELLLLLQAVQWLFQNRLVRSCRASTMDHSFARQRRCLLKVWLRFVQGSLSQIGAKMNRSKCWIAYRRRTLKGSGILVWEIWRLFTLTCD